MSAMDPHYSYYFPPSMIPPQSSYGPPPFNSTNPPPFHYNHNQFYPSSQYHYSPPNHVQHYQQQQQPIPPPLPPSPIQNQPSQRRSQAQGRGIDEEKIIDEFTDLTATELRDSCQERGIPSTGQRSKILHRLRQFKICPYDFLKSGKLKELCRERKLSFVCSARKDELVRLLSQDDLTPKPVFTSPALSNNSMQNTSTSAPRFSQSPIPSNSPSPVPLSSAPLISTLPTPSLTPTPDDQRGITLQDVIDVERIEQEGSRAIIGTGSHSVESRSEEEEEDENAEGEDNSDLEEYDEDEDEDEEDEDESGNRGRTRERWPVVLDRNAGSSSQGGEQNVSGPNLMDMDDYTRLYSGNNDTPPPQSQSYTPQSVVFLSKRTISPTGLKQSKITTPLFNTQISHPSPQSLMSRFQELENKQHSSSNSPFTPTPAPKPSKWNCPSCGPVPSTRFPSGETGCSSCGMVDPESKGALLTSNDGVDANWVGGGGRGEAKDGVLEELVLGRDSSGRLRMTKKIKRGRAVQKEALRDYIDFFIRHRVARDKSCPPDIFISRFITDSQSLFNRAIDANPVKKMGLFLKKSGFKAGGRVDGRESGQRNTFGEVMAVACMVVIASRLPGMEWFTLKSCVEKGWIDCDRKAYLETAGLIHKCEPLPPVVDTSLPFATLLAQSRVFEPERKYWGNILRTAANDATRESLITPIVDHLEALIRGGFAKNRLGTREDYTDRSTRRRVVNDQDKEQEGEETEVDEEDGGGSTRNSSRSRSTDTSTPRHQRENTRTGKFLVTCQPIMPQLVPLAIRIMRMWEETRETGKDRRSIACACVMGAMQVLVIEGLGFPQELLHEMSLVLKCQTRDALRYHSELQKMVNDWAQFLPSIGMMWKLPKDRIPYWYHDGRTGISHSNLFAIMLPNVMENAVELSRLATDPAAQGKRDTLFWKMLYQDVRQQHDRRPVKRSADEAFVTELNSHQYQLAKKQRLKEQQSYKELREMPLERQVSMIGRTSGDETGSEHQSARGTSPSSASSSRSPTNAPAPLASTPGASFTPQSFFTPPVKIAAQTPLSVVIGKTVPFSQGWSDTFPDDRNKRYAPRKVLKESHTESITVPQVLVRLTATKNRLAMQGMVVSPYDTEAVNRYLAHAQMQIMEEVMEILNRWQSERISIDDKTEVVSFKTEVARLEYTNLSKPGRPKLDRNSFKSKTQYIRRHLLSGEKAYNLPFAILPQSILTARMVTSKKLYYVTPDNTTDDKDFLEEFFAEGEFEGYFSTRQEVMIRTARYQMDGTLAAHDERQAKRDLKTAAQDDARAAMEEKQRQRNIVQSCLGSQSTGRDGSRGPGRSTSNFFSDSEDDRLKSVVEKEDPALLKLLMMRFGDKESDGEASTDKEEETEMDGLLTMAGMIGVGGQEKEDEEDDKDDEDYDDDGKDDGDDRYGGDDDYGNEDIYS